MEINKDLLKHLSTFGLYDLERLKTCFQYEYRAEPENRECIQDILNHIDAVMESIKKNNT